MNDIEKIEKVDEFAVCLTGTPVRNIMNKTRTRQPAGISFVEQISTYRSLQTCIFMKT